MSPFFISFIKASKKENLAETTRDILLYVMRDLSHKVEISIFNNLRSVGCLSLRFFANLSVKDWTACSPFDKTTFHWISGTNVLFQDLSFKFNAKLAKVC